jgi:hypothetical protein
MVKIRNLSFSMEQVTGTNMLLQIFVLILCSDTLILGLPFHNRRVAVSVCSHFLNKQGCVLQCLSGGFVPHEERYCFRTI